MAMVAEATIPNGLPTAHASDNSEPNPALAVVSAEVANPPGDNATAGAEDGAAASAPVAEPAAAVEAATEGGAPHVKAEVAAPDAAGSAVTSLPAPVLPAPAAGTSTLLAAPPKLVLKLGKAATASLKAAAAAKAQKLAAASAAAAGAGGGATAAPPSPQAPEYSFPSASLSASSYGDLLGPTGGGQEASSSWAPSDHVASGDENVPLDIRDEVISPPTTFEEANAEGGIPKPHPGKARYVEVLGGKQCSICLHVLRAWAGTHIKSHESSNKHKEAVFRREMGIPLGGRRRKPKPPKKPREPKKPKDPNDPNSKRTPARVRKPKAVVEAEAEAAKGGGSKKVAESAAKKGTVAKAVASPPAAAAAKNKKAAAGSKRGAGQEEDDGPAFGKVAKRRRA